MMSTRQNINQYKKQTNLKYSKTSDRHQSIKNIRQYNKTSNKAAKTICMKFHNTDVNNQTNCYQSQIETTTLEQKTCKWMD